MAIQLKTTGGAQRVQPHDTNTLVGPQYYNSAFGPNYFVLEGITTEPKYALQIWDSSLTYWIADLRQAADPNGEAAFDIQNILQAYVAPGRGFTSTNDGKYNIEWTGYFGAAFQPSFDEVFDYVIKFGYENADGQFIQVDSTQGPFTAIGGAYDQEPHGAGASDYPNRSYVAPTVECDIAGCVVPQLGLTPARSYNMNMLLTDNINHKTPSQLKGGVPAELFTSNVKWVTCNKTTFYSYATVAFLNKVNTDAGSYACEVNASQIAAVRIQSYDGNTPLEDVVYYNTVTEGGGPDTFLGEGLTVNREYTAVYFGAGGRNLLNDISAQATHYYISTHTLQNAACPVDSIPGYENLALNPIEVWRWDILDSSCNDYPVVNVSWLNSRGYRDYFLFNKKQELSSTVQRQSYYTGTEPVTHTTYNDWSKNNRGMTTYNATVEDTMTITTDWLTDSEAAYLRSLFISSDVKIQYANDINMKAVQIMDASYVQKTSRKDQLFQYTITLKTAKYLNQNRG